MKLFGLQVTRDTAQREIVAPRPIQREPDPALQERVNQLETDVEQLRLDNSERQLAVLNAVEKIMHQLRARERKRERDSDEESPDNGAAGGGLYVGGDHMAGGGIPFVNRFRRF